MDQVVRQHGWDGEWFLRAYDDFGAKIGSKECEEGKIFIESNGYCVLAGIGLEDGLAAKALESTRKHLATKHGIVLQQPAYSRYYLNLGEISSYPPGYKENAGIFCHNNPWVIIARDAPGPRRRGARLLQPHQSLGARRDQRPASLRAVCLRADDRRQDAPTHGEAKNSWLTGTAAWNYYAIAQWILGIRTSLEGLEIAPVIPKSWPGFTATRIYRGVVYKITIERQGEGNQIALTVDGQPIEGNVDNSSRRRMQGSYRERDSELGDSQVSKSRPGAPGIFEVMPCLS